MPTGQARLARAALLLALVLAGCGFQWRGTVALAYPAMALQAPTDASVAQALRGRLTVLTQVVDIHSAAPKPALVIEWLDEKHERVVVGVNSAGQVRELELRTRVRFAVRRADGDTVLPPTELVQRRDVSYTEAAALAKESEEALLRRDMERELVQQILHRLQALHAAE